MLTRQPPTNSQISEQHMPHMIWGSGREEDDEEINISYFTKKTRIFTLILHYHIE